MQSRQAKWPRATPPGRAAEPELGRGLIGRLVDVRDRLEAVADDGVTRAGSNACISVRASVRRVRAVPSASSCGSSACPRSSAARRWRRIDRCAVFSRSMSAAHLWSPRPRPCHRCRWARSAQAVGIGAQHRVGRLAARRGCCGTPRSRGRRSARARSSQTSRANTA